eukprot:jgi/Tetstr1/435922/TSEL_002658.t1
MRRPRRQRGPRRVGAPLRGRGALAPRCPGRGAWAPRCPGRGALAPRCPGRGALAPRCPGRASKGKMGHRHGKMWQGDFQQRHPKAPGGLTGFRVSA